MMEVLVNVNKTKLMSPKSRGLWAVSSIHFLLIQQLLRTLDVFVK